MARTSPALALCLIMASIGVLSTPASRAQTPTEPVPGQPGKDVVWVPTQPAVIEKMLDMAQVTPRDFVVDLGSGDGRNVIAAAKRGARALGIEYDHNLVELSRKLARDAGVSDKARFVQGDMYKADISEASVLALFLTPETLDEMRDKFLAMKPGSRIVLNTFPVTDWEPDLTETIGPPCKAYCTAMLVIVPARVAGTWRMGGAAMTLRQDFQFVRGTIGPEKVEGRLRGDQISFKAGETQYSGVVTANRMEGEAQTGATRSNWAAVRQ